MNILDQWENFYIIVGSSAGALIGLQFIVITLISEKPLTRNEAEAGDAFSTPSVVNFAVVLLLSAIASAPWQGVVVVTLLWGLVGITGVIYTVVIAMRMRSQRAYRPMLYDWFFHIILPLAAYAMLAGSAFAMHSYSHPALFFVGTGSLILLFAGIHNTWDGVTYHVFVRRQGRSDPKSKE